MGWFTLQIPENFQQTVKCYDPSQHINYHAGMCSIDIMWCTSCELTVVMATVNPQTQEFCDKLGIVNPFVPMRGQLPWWLNMWMFFHT